MLYESLNLHNIKTVPKDLLNLFILYRKNILENSENNTALRETSEDYIITNYISNTPKSDKTFSEALFYYIDNLGFTEIDVYKRANINRRLFSKIKSNSEYHPSFGTVTALALALELTTEEYEEFLKCASYALPMNSYINITLKYCFDNKLYNLSKVDMLIFAISNKTLKDL